MYFAQAREYGAEAGRFVGTDIIKGFAEYPVTFNEYTYCWSNPELYVDEDREFPTIIAGAFIGGGITSFTSSVVGQVLTREKISLKKAIVSAAGGAVKGAIAGSGIGMATGVIATGVTGALTSVADQIIVDNKNVNEIEWLLIAFDGIVDAISYGVGRYKLEKKGSTIQEKLRKKNDEVHELSFKLAEYEKKRRKAKDINQY